MNKKSIILPDFFITLPIILLLSLSILVIYSSDPKLAVQQAILALVGLGIYWALSLLDLEVGRQIYHYLYVGVLALLIIVFLLGVETRGVLRWIPLGPFQFQPSEFAKPVLILFLAGFWSTHSPIFKNILKSFLIILPMVVLIFKQPDLGTALTLIVVWSIMLIGANISLVKLAVMSGAALLLTPLTWFFLRDYQKERILSFLSPSQDPLGMGYNVIQSTIAVGSGQFWGRGLGRGTQSRLRFLPEFRTDFVFASIAEELGFLASALVLILYGIIFGRAFQILGKIRSKFDSLVLFGVLGILFFQVTVNIGMNIGILPITGITLPLLSYGGSSMLSTLISLSFVASISRFGQIDTLKQSE